MAKKGEDKKGGRSIVDKVLGRNKDEKPVTSPKAEAKVKEFSEKPPKPTGNMFKDMLNRKNYEARQRQHNAQVKAREASNELEKQNERIERHNELSNEA